jgi:uncharacterized protein with HEPN domain
VKDRPPGDALYLESMREAMARIRRYVGRKRRAAFLADPQLQDALIRNLEVIGEAAGRVSRDLASHHPGIPWRDIAGMRHRLIHGYLKVNLDTVWQAVARDLPRLARQLDRLLASGAKDARRPVKPARSAPQASGRSLRIRPSRSRGL